MKTSFCTIAYRAATGIELPAILQQVAAAGFDGAELWWPHVSGMSASQLDEVRACADELGLGFPMVSPYLGNFNLEMTNRREMIDRTVAAAPVAAVLGSPLLRAFAGWTCECSSLTASEEYWAYNLDGFTEMVRVAADHDLDIAIETHGATLCDSLAGVRRFADHCGPRIKVNLQLDDIAANSGLADGVAVYRELVDMVVHAHVPADLPDQTKRDEYAGMLKAMLNDGFSGYVSAEWCKPTDDPEAMTITGYNTIESLRA